ncbi:unnamed protein product [Laminaria digitata]
MQSMGVIRRGISSTRGLRGEVRSSGSIFDPYVYRGKGSPGLPPMMTQDGLKTRWGIVRGHVKSGMCAGVIQARNESGTKTHFKHVPDFHASKFPSVANKVFKAFIEAHRKGDMHALAGLTTEELYASLKTEIKNAKSKGLRRVAFRLSDFKEPTQVLQMRVDRKKHVSPKEGWGQVTCRLCTERELVSVDANGKELRRAEDEEMAKAQNVTIGTFEVFFGDTAGRWRIALMRESSVVPASAATEPGQAVHPNP